MSKIIICEHTTIAALKKHVLYTSIHGRSGLNKAELCKAINKQIKKKVKTPEKKVKTPEKKVKTPEKRLYFPKEMRELLLLNMSPATLKNACVTDKQAKQICKDDKFWEAYYKSYDLPFKKWTYKFAKRISIARRILLSAALDDIEKICFGKAFNVIGKIPGQNVPKMVVIFLKMFEGQFFNHIVQKLKPNYTIQFTIEKGMVFFKVVEIGSITQVIRRDEFLKIFELLTDIKVFDSKNKTIKTYPDY